MLRFTPLLVLASCGILGLSQEDRDNLARYQRNASTYYDGSRYAQALDQVRRGREIEPDDYKLNFIRGWCLLRQSQEDPSLLESAAEQFEFVIGLRAEEDHGPQALLGYGVAHGKLGWERLRRAEEIRQEVDRLRLEGDAKATRIGEAQALETEARGTFARAEHYLQVLRDSGQYLTEANYNLMYVAVWRGDYDKAVDYGSAYLELVAEIQDGIREKLAQTLDAAHERDLRIRLQNRINEELEMRGFLANLHYKHGHHELVVAQLDEVLRKNPRRYNEYFNRGRSLLQIGRKEQAHADLQRFLTSTQLEPGHPQIDEAMRLLREL